MVQVRGELTWTRVRTVEMETVVDPGKTLSKVPTELAEGLDRRWALQYSCLENPWDRGVWWAAVYGVAQSWTRLM